MVFKSKEKNVVKSYNQKYYAQNKAKIIGGMLKKVECDVCKRTVNHQNLPKHKCSKLCRNTAARLIARERVKDDIDLLKSEIQSLKDQMAKLQPQ